MTSSTISPQPVPGVVPPPTEAGLTAHAAPRTSMGRTLGAGLQAPARLLALTPIWVLVGLSLFGREYVAGLLQRPPDVLGVPLGAALAAFAIAWMLAGAALVWRRRSALGQSLALLVFTIPATIVVAFAPVAILAVRVMG